MVERILEDYQASTYDFRETANPADPLEHLFPEWVPYYRLKAAIARTLAPRSILEIGVRYGYSGAAFLHGAPGARFVGIDLDSDSFGGTKGAIEWARRILPPGQHELIVADTQKMDRLPGGLYDLIHVDGQQDGDGTFRDLQLSLRQGRHVLVDGYMWTTQNFRAASEFLLRQKDIIEYYFVIPGYAGELLIKTRESAWLANRPGTTVDSAAIRDTYDASYYMRDFGGPNSFRELRDYRLRSIFELAMLRQPRRLLDLGCGRGEIAIHAARQGCEVVAVDYSPAAIEIARTNLAEVAPEIRNRVTLLCEDVTTFTLHAPVDVAVAGDLVDHMATAELNQLYARVARQLTPQGIFLVHTSSNKWCYDYDYPRRRRIAASVGAYLPPNGRSRHEQLTHINEQSPRVLRRQLRQHFPHVVIWLGSPMDPFSSLIRHCSPQMLAAQPDLFALASLQPIDSETLKARFKRAILTTTDFSQLRLETSVHAMTLPRNGRGLVEVTLHNHSNHLLSSYSEHPVYFAYHWLQAASRTMVVFEGHRSTLVPSSAPGSRLVYSPACVAPSEAGHYILQITLVQEGILWFETAAPSVCVEVSVTVA